MSIEMFQPVAYDNAEWQWLLNQVASLSIDRSREEKDLDGKIAYAAKSIIDRACQLKENLEADKGGGCLVIGRRNYNTGIPPVAVFYGGAEKADIEFTTKNDKYIAYAYCKAGVLIQNPEFISSRENKDLPIEDQMFISKDSIPEGGIALSDGTILAFSGFAGYVDEAICIAVALKMNLINETEAGEIAMKGTLKSFELALQLISDNPSALVIRT